VKHWFPKKRPIIIMRERIFDQNPERDDFNRRLAEAARK
jgi:hypothetical protein